MTSISDCLTPEISNSRCAKFTSVVGSGAPSGIRMHPKSRMCFWHACTEASTSSALAKVLPPRASKILGPTVRRRRTARSPPVLTSTSLLPTGWIGRGNKSRVSEESPWWRAVPSMITYCICGMLDFRSASEDLCSSERESHFRQNP